MTGLRDARLRKALEHAPDAHMRPAAAVRAAVLRAAHDAVAHAPAAARGTGGWARWRGAANRPGRARMPWNAAFATVLVAGIAALLWRGQEVPDARLDPPAPASAPAPAPAPAPAVPAPPEVAAPATGAAPAKARQRADVPAPSPPVARAEPKLEAAGGDALDSFTELRVLADARSASVGRDQGAALPGLMRALTSSMPTPAPALASPSRRAEGNMARKESADAAASASAAAPASPSAGMAAEQSAGPAPPPAPPPAALANAAPEPPLRIELRRGNEISATLEISGGRWRLQGADGSVRSGPADAATLRALRAELARLGLL